MRVLVLHGPNLKLLGARFDEVNEQLKRQAVALGFELEQFQANSEGELIDELHRRREWLEAVLVNPSSLSPVAHGLAEALELIGKRAIEVQLVEGRSSVLRDLVEAQCHGDEGYTWALEVLAGTREAQKTDSSEVNAAPARLGKSIGRKSAAAEPVKVTQGTARKTIGKAASPASAPGKTIGRVERVTAWPALTRAMVKTKMSERLAGSLAGEALAGWARAQWQSLMAGAEVEPGQKDLLEDVLLTLASSAKASDHAILSAMAKLDR